MSSRHRVPLQALFLTTSGVMSRGCLVYSTVVNVKYASESWRLMFAWGKKKKKSLGFSCKDECVVLRNCIVSQNS